MRIDELVSMDMEGDFVSDVKLSDYEDPELNRGLLRNYIFTVHAPAAFGAAQRSLSAKDVLDQLRSILAFKGENRIALIANYGHGKSHLALVLANFLARPVDSEEVEIVLSRLEQALSNPAQSAVYRDFKTSKGECLVVRLQGDAFSDLQEGFMRALEQALSEHVSTRGVQMPFWHRNAEVWLRTLQGDALRKAEAYLATQNTDLPSLLSGLRREGTYELVRGTFHQVTGAYPDFGWEVNLADLVVWAVDEVCVPNRLGGLLILFDEFSLFLQKYMAAHTVGKLQDLLNGISKRQGKSAFLAFSQQDVDTVVDTYAHGQHREDVRKELERLPKDKRARLYSLMESVLGSYLKQQDAAWQSWSAQLPVKGAMARARESVLQHFGQRYSTLMWNPMAVEQKVVKGCFPLHPLTTAILADHSFESGGGEAPRTALEFVRRTWENLRSQAAETQDGAPNFVYATALVDFYGEQVSRKWYDAYRNALETSPIPLDQEHRSVLKALLIEQAVPSLDRLKLRKSDQLELLSDLSGVHSDRIKDLVRELSEARIIQYDPYNKVSSLLPPGFHSPEMEKVIKGAIDRTPIDHALMEEIAGSLPALEPALLFGHASDWSPRQVVLTASMFTPKELKQLLQAYRIGAGGIESGDRGLVVWLIAQSQDEQLQMRQTAQGVLDSALDNTAHPLPGIVVLPRQVTPALLESARRLKALAGLNRSEREKIGSVMYQQEVDRATVAFKSALAAWAGDLTHCHEIPRHVHEIALPAAYYASVQALKHISVKSVVTECYRQAYAYRVEFYTQYSISGRGPNQLRNAVQNVAHWLLGDTAGSSIPNLAKKDVQHQLATVYLNQQWGLLAVGSYSIQRPTLRAMQEAWDLLEQSFPPGCKEVLARPVLLALLNPPYGHDYNTLTLLLSAWVGYHQHDLTLSLNGMRIAPSRLRDLLDEKKKPQDFVSSLCVGIPLAVSRSVPDEVAAQVSTVLERIRQGGPFTLAQAQEALVTLEKALSNPHIPQGKQEEATQLLPHLQEALKTAQEYDNRVGTWLSELRAASFDTLLGLQNTIGTLPAPTLVLASSPQPKELESRWETAIQTALEAFCAQNACLDDVADYRDKEGRLKRGRKALDRYPLLAKEVDQALEKLGQRLGELQRQEGEKAIIAEIKGMRATAALADLYDYRQRLIQFTDLSTQTARLRDEMQDRIENSIHQYEQFAQMLPAAIEQVGDQSELRRQRDALLQNLNQLNGTLLYAKLQAAQQRIDQLNAFFEEVRLLDSLPRATPADLAAIEQRIRDINTQYGDRLTVRLQGLLDTKRLDIDSLRRGRALEARAWLQRLAQRCEKGGDLEELLRLINTPPVFLPDEDMAQLGGIKQAVLKKRNQNVLWQIEGLFRSISDLKIRRECLERLQELVGD